MGLSSKYFWRFDTLNLFCEMYSCVCCLLSSSNAECFRRNV